jgi:signal transduction histidine kinase
MSLVEIAELLTVPPGSLVYHLMIAMTLAVILSLAIVYRTRLEDSSAQRWIVVGVGLLVLRMILLLCDGLIWLDVIKSSLLIASLDRFISLLGMLAFMWLCDLPTPRLSQWFFIGGLVLGVLGLLIAPISLGSQAESVPFNRTWIDAAWSFISLGISLTATITLVTFRPQVWEFKITPFVSFSVGILLHISLGPTTASAAGFVRLAEIAAYPLFAVLAARALASAQTDIIFEAQETFRTPPSLELTTLMVAISDLATVFNSNDQSQLAQRSVEIIARRMNSDCCLFMIPIENEERILIAAGFDLFEEKHLNRATVKSQNIPLIADALHHGKSLIIQKEFSAHELQALQPLMTQGIAGPTLFVPLSSGKRVIGGFLLVSHASRQLWSSKDRQTMELLASLLFQRFQELRRTTEKVETEEEREALSQAEERIHALEEEKQYLQDILEAHRTSDDSGAEEDLKALMTIHEKDQEVIERLKKQIEHMQSELASQGTSTESYQFEQLVGERLLALQELADTRQSLSTIEEHTTVRGKGRDLPASDVDAVVSIAQELRQPMSSILGYTELLLSESVGLLGATQQKFLERIRTASDRMGKLLNDLIRICAVEVKSLNFAPGPVEVIHCLEEAISQVSSKLQKKNISLHMDIPEDQPAILGDEDAIVQIFFHLLENAIGASPPDSNVVIRMQKQEAEPNDFLMLSVTDSGEGIPSSDLQRVFQRTYSGDKVTIQGISDKGVGLSIVKSISEKLGGRVWVDSEMGKGSVFTILLPIAL